MIRHTPLGEVVGTNLLGPVTAAQLGPLLLGLLLMLLIILNFIEPCTKQSHGLFPVLHLRTLLLTLRHHARGLMDETHRRRGLVDVLSAGTGGTEHLHADVRRVDLHVHILGLRHHRHRGGRGMDTAAAFGLRHPLHTMHAGLVLKPGIRPLSVHDEHHLLETAEPGLVEGHQLCPPAPTLRVAGVHAVQLRRKEGRLLTAGTAPDLQDDVFIVIFILRQQQKTKLLGQTLLLALGLRQLLLCHLEELRILLPGKHLQGIPFTLLRTPKGKIGLVNGLQL